MYSVSNFGKTLVGSLFCVTALLSGCSDAVDPLIPSPKDLQLRFGGNAAAPGKACASVTVTLSPSTLTIGQTATASAVLKSSNGKTVSGSVSWSSNTPSVATVSSNGVVTAAAAGTASVTASSSSCSGAATVTVAATPAAGTVSSVVISFDSPSLTPGQNAQASAKAVDANGNIVFGQTVAWKSLNTAIAIVSSTGQVTALSGGSVLIEGKVQTISGSASMAVTTVAPVLPPDGIARPADMINATFEDGTLGGFGTWNPAKIDVVSDPTGSGRGKVARLRYSGSNGDDNTSLMYQPKVGFGRSVFFRGEFYIPISDNMTDPNYQRKLVYFKQHEDWNRYPSFGGHKFRTFIKLTGDELGVDAVYEPYGAGIPGIDAVRTYGPIAYGMKPRTWYTLEVQQTTESSIGARNGILRVWLDGKLLFEKTNMQWSDPNWTRDESIDDIYWDTFMIGQQVNLFGASFDEYRYWNNVAFSSQRIGQ